MPPRFTLLSPALAAATFVCFWSPSPAGAQPLLQPTPFSIQLSPSVLLAERPVTALPMWVESVSVLHPPKDPLGLRCTVVRLRIRKLSSLVHSIEFRVTLAAGPSGYAEFTAWNEAGTQLFHSQPFGSSNNALTEVVRIQTEGVDYIDLALPLDGSRLTGLFTSAMKKSPVLHPIDFPPPAVLESFTANSGTNLDPDRDHLLLGRVAATLEIGPLTLTEETPTLIDFELSHKPSVALLTFEARSLLATAPPLASLNGVELAPLSVTFPDLADPAWRTKKGGTLAEPVIQYSGWTRVQGILPHSALLSGANQVSLQQPYLGGTVEIRNVQLQIRNLR